MICDREKLSYYVDGELDPDDVQQLQQHLAECEQCTADLAIYRQVDDAVGRLEQRRAPSELRRLVYHKVEEQRRARGRWGLAAPLLRPAVPLTIGFVMLAGGVAVWRVTLPPGSAPVMTAAFTVQETPDSLDGLRLELVFDRPVAADSVAQAITIDPPLPVSQRVHENKVELIPTEPLRPGSSYRVTVSHVRAQSGNAQSDPVVFNLTTAPVARLVQESSPAALQPLGPTAATKVPQVAQAAPTEGVVNQAAPTPIAVATRPAAVAQADVPKTQQTAPTPTLVPRSVEPTTTPTAMVAATVVPTGAATSAVPQPTAAGTAMAARPAGTPPLPTSPPTPTVAPRVSATAGSAPASPTVPSALTGSSLLEANPDLQRKLGAAEEPEKSVRLIEQSFQGGLMLSRTDSDQIFVLLRATGRWQSFPNTWRPGEVLASAGPRPAGTFEPLRGFGKLWRDQPAVKLQLGWPVYEERSAAGSAQTFEQGLLVRTADSVAYAMSDDGTWRVLPDPRR